MMQINPLGNGIFQIGNWVEIENDLQFEELDQADSLEAAYEKAHYYNDQAFMQAKHEIDLIGGIDSAKQILNKLESSDASFVVFPKKDFSHEKVSYLDSSAHALYLQDAEKNDFADTYWLSDYDIKSNLMTIRFLTY